MCIPSRISVTSLSFCVTCKIHLSLIEVGDFKLHVSAAPPNLSEDVSQSNQSSEQHFMQRKALKSCVHSETSENVHVLNQETKASLVQTAPVMMAATHSHAAALCLIQLQPGENGWWCVCGGLMGGLPHMVPHSAVCALHLIVVALSWDAHSSHSLCHFTATIQDWKCLLGTLFITAGS